MSDFNQPQRQSVIGILVMFADTVQKLGRAFWPILLVVFVKEKNLSWGYFALGILAFIVLVGVIAYLKYRNFTFYIDEDNDEFIVSEGVVNKTKTTIQLNKIQQVNIKQSLIQRLVGVYALDVDTAGSDKKEGNIKAISHDLALSLKAKLLENEGSAQSAAVQSLTQETQVTQETPFLKINFISLIKVGITSNYVRSVGLILTFFFTIMDNLRNIGHEEVWENKSVQAFVSNNSVVYSILLSILILVSVVFVINIARTLIKFFDYTITKQKGSLLLFHGLINTQSTILKPEKVQIVKVSQNYFQKKLDVLEIKIRQAISNGKEDRKSLIEIPGCNAVERDGILQLLFQKLPKKGEMLKPNFRKLGFSIVLIIVLPLVGFYSIAHYGDASLFKFSHFAWAYSVFFVVVLSFGFRNYRLFISKDHIIKQSGAWDVENQIITLEKIQAITTSQLFWHKSLNIGSLTLHTAGGNITFHLGNYNRIQEYVNLWLYEIETSDSNWM
jgi:putative membrane protein